MLAYKYNLEAMLVFEAMGKSDKPIYDSLKVLYACHYAADNDTKLSFDEFVEYMTENRKEYIEATDWLTAQIKQYDEFVAETRDEAKKKKLKK